MAGSIKWFEYTTDTSDAFAIQMDESNGEAVGNSDYAGGSTAEYKLPGNIDPRYARYASTDNKYSKNIICSTQAILAASPTTITAQDGNGGTVTLGLTQRVGEVVKILPRADDTGIDDGDAT